MAKVSPNAVELSDGTKVLIRTAIASDAERMKHCVTKYIEDNSGQVLSRDEYPSAMQDEKTWISDFLDNPSRILLVAEIDGEVVGNIDFQAGTRKRLRHVGEFGMSVLPSFRGRGIGALLLSSLVEWARNHSEIEKINLRVLSNNKTAISMYKKYGFIEVGRRVNEIKYEDGSYADEIHMHLFV